MVLSTKIESGGLQKRIKSSFLEIKGLGTEEFEAVVGVLSLA